MTRGRPVSSGLSGKHKDPGAHAQRMKERYWLNRENDEFMERQREYCRRYRRRWYTSIKANEPPVNRSE